MKRLCALVLALALTLCGCSGRLLADLHAQLGSPAAPAGKGESWAIFVYLCGADLESVDGSGSYDLAEMQEVPFDGSLTFVVMTGGAEKWGSSRIDPEALEIWQVDGGGMRRLASLPSANMGDAGTLARFLTFCADVCPDVQHRGLVLWNHGGGSVDGVCFDERYDDDSLLLPELASALETGGMTYDFIGFDACMMATAETAAVCAPYADYLIGSEETEAGLGWAYRELGEAVCVKHQTMPALGVTICDDYFASCGWMGEQKQATMSVIDLRRLPALADALDAAAAAMLAADGQTFGEQARRCAAARSFGGNSPEEGYTNMVDLGDMMAQLRPVLPEAAAVTAALEACVVHHVAGDDCPEASGLALYYPLSPNGVQEIEDAAAIALCPSYAELLRRMAAGASGGSAVGVLEVFFDADGYYTLRLDPDTLDALEQVTFDLYRELDDGSYSYLGRDDMVYIDWETGLVQDAFDGTWLTLPDGQLLQACLTDAGETENCYAAPVLRGGSRTTLRLTCEIDSGAFRVLGTWEPGRGVAPLAPGDVLTPVYTCTNALEQADSVERAGMDCRVDERFAVTVQTLPEGYYDYRFCVTDIYGNETTTSFTYFYVDEEGEVWY